MKTYRFDPDLVPLDRTEICDWARANNLKPEQIPDSALVVVDAGQLTVEVWSDLAGNPSLKAWAGPAPDLMPRRCTVTVPLLVKPPAFAALKPGDAAGTAPR